MNVVAPFAGAPPEELRITGDTYPVRQSLHRLGCVYSRRFKCWIAPDHPTAAYARLIVPLPPLERFLRDQAADLN